MMRRKDAGFLFILLLISVLLLVGSRLKPAAGAAGTLRLTVNGVLYGEYPLEEGRSITVRQTDGQENVLCMTQNGFYMLHANCKNQSCIAQGAVTLENYARRALKNHILCLPNRLDAELTVSDEASSLPDV